jgi:shikimate kinase
MLRASGMIVLLWAEPDEILRRCGDRSSRPLLAAQEDPRRAIEEMLRRREAAYRAAADAVVETTGLNRDEAADQVLEVYRAWVDAASVPEGRA